jgi:hypothetical protein
MSYIIAMEKNSSFVSLMSSMVGLQDGLRLHCDILSIALRWLHAVQEPKACIVREKSDIQKCSARKGWKKGLEQKVARYLIANPRLSGSTPRG